MVLERFSLCSDIEKCIRELNWNGQLAVGFSRQHALNNPDIGRHDIHCFPSSSNIYTFSVLMNTRQDSNLLPHINDLINRFVEHGFVSIWERRSQNATIVSMIERVHPLSVEHILGAVVVLGVGLTLAIMAFAIEWLRWKLRGKCRRTTNCRRIIRKTKAVCVMAKQSSNAYNFRRPKRCPKRRY